MESMVAEIISAFLARKQGQESQTQVNKVEIEVVKEKRVYWVRRRQWHLHFKVN
jgi:hypothetical protein